MPTEDQDRTTSRGSLQVRGRSARPGPGRSIPFCEGGISVLLNHRKDANGHRRRCAHRRRGRTALAAALAVAVTALGARRDRRPDDRAAPEPRRQRQQLAEPDLGPGRNRLHPRRAARYADGAAPPSPARTPATSATGSSTTPTRTCSPSGRSPSGASPGVSSSTTPSACAGAGVGDARPELANIPFNATDPLEELHQHPRRHPVHPVEPPPPAPASQRRASRSTPSARTSTPFAVYGGTNTRLEWLRDGPVDGNLTNNSARLLLPGRLPAPARRPRQPGHRAGDGRRRPAARPTRTGPWSPATCGPTRTSRCTATHTLFAREHNRIVACCPAALSEEDKFQIARRVVIAEQQYITYNEFLPALGVTLPPYRATRPNVNATLSNEFATVGYRAHSMIHGEIEIETERRPLHPEPARRLRGAGRRGAPVDGDEVELAVPLNVAFFNPDLARAGPARPAAAGHRPGGAVQERRADRQPAPQRAVPDPGARQPRSASTGRPCPSASAAWSTSARSTSSAAATTACRATTSCARPTGCRPRPRSRRSPVSRPRRSP